ncbi:MAG: twin-arginine translocation signal domain-containing protein [Thermoanaerobaculales bacterium]|nr:twin-arginine translocation signal domain-containing protein [Thermoanaerobaculales bacterium]
MTKTSGTISRRAFMGTAAGAAAAGVIGTSGHTEPKDSPTPPSSRVVLIRRREVFGEDGAVQAKVLHRMLNEAVTALLQTENSTAAWKRLVRPDDVVGIKSNIWKNLATPPALEQAIRAEVESVGVDPGNVSVDDRNVLSNPVFKRATALINVRPMRIHHWSGLGTCLKNLIMFVPRPWEYHGDSCASLGGLWQLPAIKDKVRLNILVMLTPQFHGIGPHSFSKRFVWPYGGLIVGIEPAPVDATGARIIQAQRNLFFGEERPISPPAHHIEVAGRQYGLGATDSGAIELVRLGDEKGALI